MANQLGYYDFESINSGIPYGASNNYYSSSIADMYTASGTKVEERRPVEGYIIKAKDVVVMDSPAFAFPVPYKIVWDDTNDTFTEYYSYRGTTVTKTYTLTVINKGTEDEEVTEMRLPDGRVITFEGWLVNL